MFGFVLKSQVNGSTFVVGRQVKSAIMLPVSPVLEYVIPLIITVSIIGLYIPAITGTDWLFVNGCG